MSRPRVFVTDGSYSNGLAAVRALSRSGFSVSVGEREGISLLRSVAFWSRHCEHRVRYPDPLLARKSCGATLAEHFRQSRYEAAIPVGLDMVELFLEYQDSLAVQTMLPPLDSFRVASDKQLTFQHAGKIDIPIPHTVAGTEWSRLELPLVFKHPRTGAVIVHTPDEARQAVDQLGERLQAYIAQEYIPGRNGFGYFGLFRNGCEIGHFMHERLMQFPREGGVSVVARSVRDPRLHELGRRLLESMCWHGPAMVEFKRNDRDGRFYLIEINPKLWGSLDLAIQAGCNFPVWIAQWITTCKSPLEQPYRENLVYQWVIPNGIKCFLRYPEFRARFLRNLILPGVRTDLRLSDPLPSAAGLVAMAMNFRRHGS